MKKLLFAFLYNIRVSRLVAWWNRKRVFILCYHSITALDELHDNAYKQHLPRRLFETHLDHLQKHYNVISLDDYLTARQHGQPLPPYSVILTFDDGFRNFLTVVAPLLAERSFRATNFIVTNLVSATDNSEKTHCWTPADDSHYLSWPEIRTLAATQGIEFGSHTCSHPRLADVTLDAAKRELQDSYQAIAEQLQHQQLALAYPYNQTSDSLMNLVKATGYTCALTADLGPNDVESNLFSLRRTVIAGDDNLPVFVARVAGVTWWADTVRSFVRQRIIKVPTARKQAFSYFPTKELDQE